MLQKHGALAMKPASAPARAARNAAFLLAFGMGAALFPQGCAELPPAQKGSTSGKSAAAAVDTAKFPLRAFVPLNDTAEVAGLKVTLEKLSDDSCRASLSISDSSMKNPLHFELGLNEPTPSFKVAGRTYTLAFTGVQVDSATSEQGIEVRALSLPAPDTSNLLSAPPNYPNPFNPTTTISYEIAKPSQVTVTIYDQVGRQVAQLLNKYQAAGMHEVKFNAGSFPAGTYYYQICAGKDIVSKKMLVIK